MGFAVDGELGAAVLPIDFHPMRDTGKQGVGNDVRCIPTGQAVRSFSKRAIAGLVAG
jgi:hypothetical protein